MFNKEIFNSFFRNAGNAGKDITDEERKAIDTAFSDDLVIYTPKNKFSGDPYIPAHTYTEKLNEIFGIGNWALVPLSPPEIIPRGENSFFGRVDAVLFIRGNFVAYAVGVVSMPDFEHCAEGALSDALKRTAKKVGLFSELYNAPWTRAFKKRFPKGKLQGHYQQSQKVDTETEGTKEKKFTLKKLLKYVNEETYGYYNHEKHLLNTLARCYNIAPEEFALPKEDELAEWRILFTIARDYAIEKEEEEEKTA